VRLRSYLVLLVLATLCPLLAFTAFVVYEHGLTHQAAVDQGLFETARALAFALDRHFDASLATLGTLTTSEHLDTGDLAAFYRQCVRARQAHEEWLTISLFDAAGRRLFNTTHPFGAPQPPPPPVMVERFRQLVASRRPGVSDLFPAPVQKRLLVALAVPVVRAGDVRYVLSAGVDNVVLARMIARQKVPADWTLTMLDRQYVIAAHSRTQELIGQPAEPAFVARARASMDGVSSGSTKDGPSRFAFSRAPTHGWTIRLSIPAATVDATTMRPLRTILGVGGLLLVIGALLALWVGRRVTRPIQAVVFEADRLGRGLPPQPVLSVIREVADLSASLETAGREITRLHTDLERRVAERTEELRTATSEAERANEAKSAFLSGMSHELRTPLNGIIGFAQLIHDEKVGPISDEQREYLADVLISARHLLDVVNDVLDLAKIESGKMEFRPEVVDLARIIGEVRDTCGPIASGKPIEVDVAIDPLVTEVVADAARLKQVLYNYLSNAFKFTAEGGHVTIRAVPEGPERFRLEVEDSGIGIAPEKISRLFTEFEQLEGSSGKTYPGTGLGLAVTRRIVEAQGGEVGVRSTHGRGSVFFAVLPRSAA
jgi:signal transduction histidine kinase